MFADLISPGRPGRPSLAHVAPGRTGRAPGPVPAHNATRANVANVARHVCTPQSQPHPRYGG